MKQRKSGHRNKSPLKPSQWGWNPTAARETLRLSMGEMLAELFGSGEEGAMPGLWHPRADMYEYGKNLFIEIPLPGISRDQLEIHATRDMLIIKGHTGEPKKKVKYYRAELPRGEFTRVLALPHKVDPKKIHARLRKGLLTIRLPVAGKKHAEKSYKIKVEE